MRMKFAVPRSEISFIPRTKRKYIFFRTFPNLDYFLDAAYLNTIILTSVYSLENKFVVSGPENGRLFIEKEN
jgi:hypothetical protein